MTKAEKAELAEFRREMNERFDAIDTLIAGIEDAVRPSPEIEVERLRSEGVL